MRRAAFKELFNSSSPIWVCGLRKPGSCILNKAIASKEVFKLCNCPFFLRLLYIYTTFRLAVIFWNVNCFVEHSGSVLRVWILPSHEFEYSKNFFLSVWVQQKLWLYCTYNGRTPYY